MKTINILGCCICRDIFRVNECSDKYKVNKFIQSVSPVSIVEKSTSKTILSQNSLDYFTERSNFAKRNIMHDFNKSVKETIASSLSDYLIVDLCELRFKMVKAITTDGYEFLLTQTSHITEIIANRDKVPDLEGISFSEGFELDEKSVFDYLKSYAVFLTQNYDSSKIILIENLPVSIHLNDEKKCMHSLNEVSVFLTAQKLSAYYNYFESLIPDMNVVKGFDWIVGDANHLWGLDSLHFTDEYYNYLYRAINMIVDNEVNLKDKLTRLRDDYSAYFSLLEQKKLLEYFLYHSSEKNQMIKDTKLSTVQKSDSEWRIQASAGSSFDCEGGTMYCGNLESNWIILSRLIDFNQYKGKDLTLSVNFETFEAARLNLAFRYKDANGKYIVLSSKRVLSAGRKATRWLTYSVPVELPDNTETDVCIFLNEKNSKARIYEVKLDLGKYSSLIS